MSKEHASAPTVDDAEFAKKLGVELADIVVVLQEKRRQLERAELRSLLHCGLHGHPDGVRFQTAEADAELLRGDILQLERREAAAKVAMDFLEARTRGKQRAEFAKALETKQGELRTEFPDADALTVKHNRRGVASVAATLGMSVRDADLLEDPKTARRFEALLAKRAEIADLCAKLGSVGAGLDRIHQKYGPNADVVLPS
jgi:hypothetical protein